MLKKYTNNLLRIVAISLLLIGLSACNDSSDGRSNDTTQVTFAISDAPVDDLSKVIITINQITLRRAGEDDIVINQFGNNHANTITVDLLAIPNNNSIVLVDSIDLPAGRYTQLLLSVLDNDINESYVEEKNGAIKPIKQPSNELKLGGFTIDTVGVQVFVLEFDLRQAMTYNPGPDRYILKPHGVRIVDVAVAGAVAGVVDPRLFNSHPLCETKANPTVGNVVYLYQGHRLNLDQLADNFDPITANNNAPSGAIAPFSSAAADSAGNYNISFLPMGDYTIAFNCAAAGDHPEIYDGLVIPSPDEQWHEIRVIAGKTYQCDFLLGSSGCVDTITKQ
jgi:hypothetical protein